MRPLLAVLVSLAPASFAVSGAGGDSGGSSLNVFSRNGDSTSVVNHYDGSGYAVRLSRYARNGSLLRQDSHADGYQEVARAAALDDDGNTYVAGVRYWQGRKFLWAMKYTASGLVDWEWADDAPGCAAAGLEVNGAGEAWIAGDCSFGGAGSLRLARLTARGYLNWGRTFENAGPSRVQNLSVDAGSRAALTAAADGAVLTIVVDGQGRQLTTY